MAEVSLEDVSKSFRDPHGAEVHAVRQLRFTVADGELLVLMGPSGSGKSTTLRLIAGLEEPSRGLIRIDRQPVNGLSPAARDLALVFQHGALYPHLTVFDNLALGLTLRRAPKTVIHTRVHEAAEWLGLQPLLARRPETLSGGERQRVALGRALVRRPGVFLLDEPLADLDLAWREQLRRDIRELQQRCGATMLYVTHDQTEAMTLGQRIALIEDGAIQQIDAPRRLYRDPANLKVARGLGTPPINLFPGTLREGPGGLQFCGTAANGETATVQFAVGRSTPPSWEGRAVLLGLRPEHLRCGPLTAPLQVALRQVRVESIEDLGAEVLAYFALGTLHLTARLPPERSPNPGTRVDLGWAPDDCRWFDARTGAALELPPELRPANDVDKPGESVS